VLRREVKAKTVVQKVSIMGVKANARRLMEARTKRELLKVLRGKKR